MPLPSPAERRKGALLMLCASLLFSSGGLLVREVRSASPWDIVFWRSAFMFSFLSLVLLVWHGRGLAGRLRLLGRSGLVSAAFMGSTFVLFVMAVSHTTVANTAALMSTSPLVLALAGRAFLGEHPPAGIWLAVAAALAGIGLMFSEGLGPGAMLGNLCALGVPLAFAVNYVVLRRAGQHVDPVVMMLIAALFAMLAALPFAAPLSVPAADFPALAALGVLQTGAACLLLALAMRRLTAVELSLISLVEPVLTPLWVWLVLAERPGQAALAGGVMVVAAVLVSQLLVLIRERGSPSP